MNPPTLSITGRQTSHFTRMTRIYAEELGLDYEYRPIFDLMALDPSVYDGNPALKMPVLRIDGEPLFGALNICRELVHLSGDPAGFLWPEDLDDRPMVNAQELVFQAMSTEVTLILGRMNGVDPDNSHLHKARRSLELSLQWLEQHLTTLLAGLPEDRRLSVLEVTLACLAGHLEFREVVPLDPYPGLQQHCAEFERRPSAQATPYRVDHPPS